MKSFNKITKYLTDSKSIGFGFITALLFTFGCSGGLDNPGTDPRYLVRVNALGFDQKFSESVNLLKNGEESLTISENGEYFFPEKMVDSENYKVEILEKPMFQNCRVTNGEGTISGNDADVLLDCADKHWTYPDDLREDAINPLGFSVFNHTVAMNDYGDAIVAWKQTDGDADNIYISEYRNGIWTHPVDEHDHINPYGSSECDGPDIAINNSGDAVVVWRQRNTVGQRHIFMSLYKDGIWTHPLDANDYISPVAPSASVPKVAMADSGDIVIAWNQEEVISQDPYLEELQIYMSEYRNGVWSHPADDSDHFTESGFSGHLSALEMNDSGDTILIFSGRPYDNTVLYKAEYRNGNWTLPANEDDFFTAPNSNASYPEIAMDSSGNAIILWSQQYDGGTLYIAEYRNGVWEYPENLASSITLPGQQVVKGVLEMSDYGNAVIAWSAPQQIGDDYYYFIYKSEYYDGVWHNPESIDDYINPALTSGAFNTDIAMDDLGNAILTWIQSDGYYLQVYKSELVNGTWFHPEDLDDNISMEGSFAYEPKTDMNNLGNAITIWKQTNNLGATQLFMSELK